MKQSFDIKTDVFEGPLELLLQLIEKRKLFVNDVALAEVADDFIQYIENTEGFPLEQTSYFILVASTLVLIKSKSLLPNLELTDDEQSNIDELEKRLLLYKRYKELSIGLEKIFGKYVSIAPAKRRRIMHNPVFTPSDDLRIPTLLHLIHDVFSRVPKVEDIPQATVRSIVRLEDMIEKLIERVRSNLKTSFSECTGNTKEKKTIIVTFLAMLELVKRGLIQVQQTNQFTDIEMETNTIGMPHY